jgi:hypothetical protein
MRRVVCAGVTAGALLLAATLVVYAVYRRVVKSELSLG